MRRYAYKWDKLCDQYGLCSQKAFKAGNVFPINPSSSEISISDYYNDITYDLDDLISKFEVYTKKPSTITNVRYHLKYILLISIHLILEQTWWSKNVYVFFIEITNRTFM